MDMVPYYDLTINRTLIGKIQSAFHSHGSVDASNVAFWPRVLLGYCEMLDGYLIRWQ